MIVRTPSDRMPPYKPAGLVVLSVAALALSLRAAGSRPGRAYDDVPQLRIAAAQTVLDQRDLADAAAVGRLPVPEQNDIVHAIVTREIGIIALAAVVIAFLALRVLMTA